MKNFFSFLLTTCLVLPPGFCILAQVNNKGYEKSVRVEEGQTGKIYHVQVLTDDLGKQNVIEKTYNSRLEIESDTAITIHVTGESADPEDIRIHSFPNDFQWIVTADSAGHQVIRTDGGRFITIRKHIEDDSAIFANQADSDTVSIVHSYDIKITDDEDQVPDDQKIEEEVFVSREKNGDLVIRSGISGINLDEGIKNPATGKPNKLEAKISEISMNDVEFSDFQLEDLRQLKLKSLNYFPNPNNGEFNLTFLGKRKPVIIRILDPGGNLKYENTINDFRGDYSRMINLTSFEPGTYLLQIYQQGKVLNRKITLE